MGGHTAGYYILLGAMYLTSIWRLFTYTWHIGLCIMDMAHLVLYPNYEHYTEIFRNEPPLFSTSFVQGCQFLLTRAESLNMSTRDCPEKDICRTKSS